MLVLGNLRRFANNVQPSGNLKTDERANAVYPRCCERQPHSLARAAIARVGPRAHAVSELNDCGVSEYLMSERTYSRINEGWAAPPELMRPTLRKVKWAKRGKINLCVVGFAVVFGLLVVAAILGYAVSDHQLTTDAGEAESSVTRKWTEDVRSTTYHYAAYSFAVAGQIFPGEAHVPNAKWQKLSPGYALGVRYVPSNLSNNRGDITFGSAPMRYWIPRADFVVWIFSIYCPYTRSGRKRRC